MFTLFNNSASQHRAVIHCHHGESRPVHLAVEDLLADIQKVSGQLPKRQPELPQQPEGILVIGSLQNPVFTAWAQDQGINLDSLQGQWETYRIQTFGQSAQNLLLCGSDELGTLWAIYSFAQDYLGIDPCYFWTDHEPATRDTLTLGPTHIEDAPSSFRFRGWFINDEDLLTEWRSGGGKRNLDYPFYQQVVHPEVMERVVETALRLKQNLIIPASFLDITNPAEAALLEVASRRGLYISQHHIEPLGVSHFALENYWKARGRDTTPSFFAEPEAYIETWTHYAHHWAKYPKVIWQLGLRGRGDRAVWADDPQCPESPAARGKLISDAMETQRRIVADITGSDDFVTTTTLWMEGTQLHNDGHLHFPQGTIVIFADTLCGYLDGYGRTYAHQWGADFHSVTRQPERSYGIYYHVAVWGSGPHLVQGVPLPKIQDAIREAYDKGDNTYVITNVTNIREVIQGVAAVAQATWDTPSFDASTFLKKWCLSQFDEEAAPAIPSLYQTFWNAYTRLDTPGAAHPALLHDGVTSRTGIEFLEIITFLLDRSTQADTRPLTSEDLAWLYTNFIALREISPDKLLPSLAQVGKHFSATAGTALERFNQLLRNIADNARLIPIDRQSFYKHHFGTQARLMRNLTAWFQQIAQALEAYATGDIPQTIRFLEQASPHLLPILDERRALDSGKWQHWYRGDRKLNVPRCIVMTQNTIKALKAALPAESCEATPLSH